MGGGPDVKIFRGFGALFIRNFFAFDPLFTGGVFVANGDLNADGRTDLIVGAGPSGGPNVAAFDGPSGAILSNFFAYDASVFTGVRVASLPLNGRGRIITGLAPNGADLHASDGLSAQRIDEFFIGNPLYNSGVFQGSSA